MRVPDSEALAGAAYEAGFLMVDVSVHPHNGWLRLVAAR